MADNFEKICLNIYKSIKPAAFSAVIPLIDFSRKLNKKPPIPLKEKMAQIKFPKLSEKVIMVHGVSVGEVLSLENLIKKIKKEFCDYQLVITTGTVTGQELAHKKYGEIADFITYFPLDVYEACQKFIKAIKPSVVLIAETELWPNFSCACIENNVPLYIINGRISDKSYPSYLKIRNFLKLILKNYSGVFCQSELDMQRFLSIGANQDTTCVMKNLKFEIEKKDCDIDLKKGSSKILIAASTHQGEDEIALKAYKKLKKKVENLKLIIAPRHLTRINDVEILVKQTGFSYGFRTKNDTFEQKDIIILDTLGELSKVYAFVDVAYIGGSFNNTGGHNPLESVIYSKPAVSGPSIKNFRDIYAILQREEASFVVRDEKEFYSVLEELLSDDEYYLNVSKNCEKCFKNQQGALLFVVNKLKEILKN